MRYDFCVICAKPEELRHVRAIFDQQFDRRRGGSVADQLYVVGGSAEREMSIGVTTAVGMGHLNAAVRTAQMVQSHQPGILFFIGTAASLKPSQIQIGDVVIPRKAVNRIYEKVSEEGQHDYETRIRLDTFKEKFFDKNALISDISTVNCSPDAMSIIAAINFDQIKLESGDLGKVKIGSNEYALRPSKMFDDIDIFSCGMVVDSISYREFLTAMVDQNMRKVGIIDMESYGFFNAIDAIGRSGVGTSTQGVMIRGISDYAGRKQQTEDLPDNWKEKAVRNAAIVSSSLIKSLANLRPLELQPPSG